jgi:hypothetical protein
MESRSPSNSRHRACGLCRSSRHLDQRFGLLIDGSRTAFPPANAALIDWITAF